MYCPWISLSNSDLTLRDFENRGSSVSALIREFRHGIFPGCVLICGGAGMGKTALAELLAATLLCEHASPAERPCGQCKGCKRVHAGTHPDLLTPSETKKKSIGVEEIRGILSALQTHALESERRAVLLDDADRLTPQAQNSLLKNLEEHPPQTHFILTTAYETRILSTIRSRVVTVRLAPMPRDALTAWLAGQGLSEDEAQESARLSDGSPGLALTLSADETDRSLRALAYETVFRLTDEADIPDIEYRLKDLKDDFDRFLTVLERELRLCMRGIPDTEMSAAWPEARPARIARVLGFVIRAEQQRASNVNYQAVLNVLLQTIVEETKKWRLS